jgi:hypothetical protein
MTGNAPSWIARLVLAMRDYERAKATRDKALADCDEMERRVDAIRLEGAIWQSEQMKLAAASLRAAGEDGV